LSATPRPKKHAKNEHRTKFLVLFTPAKLVVGFGKVNASFKHLQ